MSTARHRGPVVPAAVSAASLAVDTGAGSELASSLETWEATVVDCDGDGDGDLDGNADGRSEFLLLNGVKTTGPAQRIQLRFE
jgi:hypothetical protein